MPINVNNQDFQRLVMDASLERPILIDFWAAWCQPCLALSPILEKLEQEGRGAWTLAKIDVEANQALASAFQIRSIPALRLVYAGQLYGELNGALPEAQMRAWLQQHLPVAAPPEAETEDANTLSGPEAVRAAQAASDFRGAYDMAADFHGTEPTNDEGLGLLAVLAAQVNPGLAPALADRLGPGHPFHLQGEAARMLLQLQAEGQNPNALPEGPAAVAYRNGLAAYLAHDFASALEQFVEVLVRDKAYNDEAARKASLAIFSLLSAQHPIAKQWRKRFDMALY